MFAPPFSCGSAPKGLRLLGTQCGTYSDFLKEMLNATRTWCAASWKRMSNLGIVKVKVKSEYGTLEKHTLKKYWRLTASQLAAAAAAALRCACQRCAMRAAGFTASPCRIPRPRFAVWASNHEGHNYECIPPIVLFALVFCCIVILYPIVACGIRSLQCLGAPCPICQYPPPTSLVTIS